MQKVQGPPHQVALPPPYDKIPPAFQTNVVISDIRDDSQKEAEYRENLADYLVFRFEKLNDPGDVDEGGNRRKPNWEKATRTRVEMSKEAAAGEVFRLKRKHRQLWEKKHALEPAQRLHLDQTLQLLQEGEHDQRFYYELVQIKEKSIDKCTAESRLHSKHYRDYRDGRKSATTRPKATASQDSRGRGPGEQRKREQLSITAFYKRLLRPELNAIDMMIQQNPPTQRTHASEATMFLPQGLYARQQAHAQAQRGPPGTRIHPQAHRHWGQGKAKREIRANNQMLRLGRPWHSMVAYSSKVRTTALLLKFHLRLRANLCRLGNAINRVVGAKEVAAEGVGAAPEAKVQTVSGILINIVKLRRITASGRLGAIIGKNDNTCQTQWRRV
ncbi:hypothetical protein ACHAP1_007853 [Verticillium nonalfalfae]